MRPYSTPQVLRPKGTAAFVDPTMSLDNQLAVLTRLRDDGVLLTNTTTKPQTMSITMRTQRRMEWSTNEFLLVEAKSVSCWQAALVALTNCELATLGVDEVSATDTKHPLYGASFTTIASILSASNYPLFELRKPLHSKQLTCIHDVFKLTFGMFLIFCHIYHPEDIDVTEYEVEGVPHYIVWNATSRLLQLYPETLVLEEKDCDSRQRIDKLLAKKPNYVRLRPGGLSLRTDVRQVFVNPFEEHFLDLPHSNKSYATSFASKGKRK